MAPWGILKMSAMENDEKRKSWFSVTQILFGIDTQRGPEMYVF